MKTDLRVLKTKENIHSHFIALLGSYSFPDITIKLLISECKINRSTFYRNYNDKYDLLNEISNELLEKYKKTIYPEIVSIEPKISQNIKNYIIPLVDFFDKNKDILIPLSKNNTPTRLFDDMFEVMVSAFVEKIRESFRIREDSKEIAFYFANLISSNILTTMKWWNVSSPETSKEKIIDIIDTCLTKGVFCSVKDFLIE